MKLLVIDNETWGLKVRAPERLAMISMIVEDTLAPGVPPEQLPNFTTLVAQEDVSGEPFALAMNAWILQAIATWLDGGGSQPRQAWGPQLRAEDSPFPVMSLPDALEQAEQFICEHFGAEQVTVAGKNPHFDISFYPPSITARIHRRLIDPTVLCTDFLADEVLPDIQTTKHRCGVAGVVRHDAYNDNIDIIRILRSQYGRYAAPLTVAKK